MTEGTQEDLVLEELKNELSDSGHLAPIQKEEIWERFRQGVEAGVNKKRRIIDMGMDIDL